MSGVFFIQKYRISHFYRYVIITGEGLQIVKHARHSWPLNSDDSLACQTYRARDSGHMPLPLIEFRIPRMRGKRFTSVCRCPLFLECNFLWQILDAACSTCTIRDVTDVCYF